MSEVHVRLEIGGVALEFRGSRAFFERQVEPLIEAAYARRGSSPERATDAAAEETNEQSVAAPEPAPPEGWRPSSPHFGQFIQQVGPRASTPDQQLMAFGFFLWNYERIDAFGSEELFGCFRVVGLPAPDDLPDRLGRLSEKKRFLEPADGDRFQLTTKGRNYVKNRLLTTV